MAGEDSRFWSDPSCIQCRAKWLIDHPSEHRQMIQVATENGQAMQYARRALSGEQCDAMLNEGVLVGYRKARSELRAIQLDNHECGLKQSGPEKWLG